MAIQIVQSKAGFDSADYQTDWIVSFDNPTQAGNAIVLFAWASVPGETLQTVNDTKNTYHSDLTLNANGLLTYWLSVAAAQSVQNITFHFSASVHEQIWIMEVSGLQPSGLLLDQSITHDMGYKGGGSWTSTAMPTTTVANELLVGEVVDTYGNASKTEDASWNVLHDFGTGFSLLGYRIVSAKAAYTNFGTNSTPAGDYWIFASALAYKGVDAAGDSVSKGLGYQLRIG